MISKTILAPIALATLSIVILPNSYGDGDLTILGNGHSKIYVSNTTAPDLDFDKDGLADFYVKAHFTGNSEKLYQVDYKIEDACVHGSTLGQAKMKVGITNMSVPYTWYSQGFHVWNPWFKSGQNLDPDKQIEVVIITNQGLNLPSPFPVSGDNIIQKSAHDEFGSFEHEPRIKELGGQAGWEGSVFFTAPTGSYLFWSIFPAQGTQGCDTISGIGIPIIVK
ncbi:MAG: hypothetical protein ACREBI_11845 [Nitrosotalea sp.]